MKLKAVYPIWLADKRRRVKVSTLYTYVTLWDSHLRAAFGEYEVTEITRFVVRQWVYRHLDNGTLCIKYIKDILIVLKMLLEYADVELEQKISSLEWAIVWPTANKTGAKGKVKSYTMEQSKKIVAYILENPSFPGLGVLLSLCGGLRIGEVSALTWGDIDLKEKTINVNKTLIRAFDISENGEIGKSRVMAGTTKTVSSTRKVPIAKNLVDIFKRFKAVCNPDYYVTSGSRHPCETRTFRNWSRKILIDAGIKEPLNFHALRHTFASLMIDSGANVKAVSMLLGHSDISTTMNLYVHPSEDSKVKEMNKLISKMF